VSRSTAGRSSRAWKALRARLRREAEDRFAQGEAVICWLCSFEIDMTITDEHDPAVWEPDHMFPVSTHPDLAEDPANIRDSHRRCNQGRGNARPENDLGVLSRCPQSESGRWVKGY
jgi:hypothetical protein